MKLYGTHAPNVHDFMVGGYEYHHSAAACFPEAITALAEAVENFIVWENLVRPWISDFEERHPRLTIGVNGYTPDAPPMIEVSDKESPIQDWAGLLLYGRIQAFTKPGKTHSALNAIVQAKNADKMTLDKLPRTPRGTWHT